MSPLRSDVMNRVLTGLLLIAATTWLSASTALAHAYLVKSEPPIGAVLAAPPEQLQLSYSEAIEPKFSHFRLYDAQGNRILELPAQLEQDGLQAVLSLSPVPPGVYTLSWQVLSAVDGHLTQGTIPFAVGVDAALSSSIGQATQTTSAPPLGRLFTRWVGFLATMILVGSLFFPLLLPAKNGIPQENLKARNLLRISWGVFVLAGVADVLLQAQRLGTSLMEILMQSRWGSMQLAKASFALALGITLCNSVEGRFNLWLARCFSALFLLASSMSGHSAVLGPMGVAADWVHQLTVALWLGGLTQLALIWFPRRLHRSPEQRATLLSELVSRFSNLALVSVLLLLGSGLYVALRQVPSWGALTSTLYGQALLAKHLLLLPVLALAAINRWLLKPRMIARVALVSTNPDPVKSVENTENTLSHLHKLIATEVLVLGVIVLFAGVLTLTAPPLGGAASALQTPLEQPQLFIQPLGQITVALSVSPVRVGKNVFEIAVTDSSGKPVEDILKVWIDFVYLDQPLGSTTAVAQPTGEGRYRVEGVLMSLPGNWHVTVSVRLKDRIDDLKAEVHLVVER